MSALPCKGGGAQHHKPMNTIEITERDVYGKTLIYVADAEVQRTIQKLTGRKSLTPSDIQALGELGFSFTFTIKQPTFNPDQPESFSL